MGKTNANDEESKQPFQFNTIKLLIYNEDKCGVLNIMFFKNGLFLHPYDQQTVPEIELKAFNHIDQSYFAAKVTEIQLIAWWIDVGSL